MKDDKISFMEYIATSEIIDHHRKAPWIEIPKSMEELGIHSWIVCTKYNANFDPPCEIIETGKSSTSYLEGLFETFQISKLIKIKKPRILFQTNVRAFIFLIALIWKIKLYFNIEKYRPFFILFIDWDGEKDKENLFLYYIRIFLYVINSHLMDLIILPTSCAKNSILKIPFINKKNIIYIPYGYPNDIYQIKKYDETSREKIILCVARITPIKGQALLINVFKELVSDFKDWNLVIAGKIENNQYYQKLVNLSGEFLGKRIFFYLSPSESELIKLYEKASIFCLPSFRESFGNVRNEAISKGIPVVTSDAGCAKDWENVGVIIFKRGDGEDLKIKLKILMENEELRKEVADRSQRNLISYTDYVKKILNIFIEFKEKNYNNR
jgi:glycosyltransferase involved in cell wall biosynthesis